MRGVAAARGAHIGACGWFGVRAVAGGCTAIGFVSFIGVFFLLVAYPGGKDTRAACGTAAERLPAFDLAVSG
jgi:hypothetical protein